MLNITVTLQSLPSVTEYAPCWCAIVSVLPELGTFIRTVAALFGATAGTYPSPPDTVAVRSPLVLPS